MLPEEILEYTAEGGPGLKKTRLHPKLPAKCGRMVHHGTNFVGMKDTGLWRVLESYITVLECC